MSKIFLLITFLVLVVTLSSCFGNTDNSSTEKNSEDVSTIPSLNPTDSVKPSIPVEPSLPEVETPNKSDEIILGDEVSSQTFIDYEGFEHTITKDSDFYDILKIIGNPYFLNVKASYYMEESINDEQKVISSGDIWFNEKSTLFISQARFADSVNNAYIQEYSFSDYILKDGNMSRTFNTFNSYTYLNEKAFGGQEINDLEGIYNHYYSYDYPMMPPSFSDDPDAKLGILHARADRIRQIINIEKPMIYHYPNNYEVNGKVIDLDSYITESFKLYDNYIVLEQISPFPSTFNTFIGKDIEKYALINGCIANGISAKHTIIYDISKGKIVSYSISGTVYSVKIAPLLILNINITFKFNDIDENEYNAKLNNLIKYVKDNTELHHE